MKNTIIQKAIDAIITEVETLLRERETGEYLKQIAKERDSWAQRFKNLEADMHGTKSMLTEARAAVKHLADKCTYLSAESAARLNSINALRAQVDLKYRAVANLATLHEEGATTIEVLTEENVKLRTKLAAFEQVIAHMTVPHHVV